MQHTSQIYNKNSLILNKDISRQKLIDILEIIEKFNLRVFRKASSRRQARNFKD